MTIGFAVSIGILMFAFSLGVTHYSRLTAERFAQEALRKGVERFQHEYDELDDKADIDPAVDEVRRFCHYDDVTVSVFDPHWHAINVAPGGILAWSGDGVAGWKAKNIAVNHKYNIVIGVPWQKTELGLRNEEVILIGVSLLLTALGAFAAWSLVGRTLSPIAKLSSQARTASIDDLTVRLKPPSDDVEIVGLVETLNGLLERTAETTASKERFYSAASHELRTPLQALSGHLELALTRQRTAEEYRAGIEEASGQACRLTDLIEDLLSLYRLDHTDSVPKRVVRDVASVCRALISEHRPLAEERGLRISCTLPEAVPVCSPRTQVDMLARNLLENALKYADPGSEVSMSLQVVDNQARLEIFNEFQPGPEWDAERLFEPFARLDSSRSSHTGRHWARARNLQVYRSGKPMGPSPRTSGRRNLRQSGHAGSHGNWWLWLKRLNYAFPTRLVACPVAHPEMLVCGGEPH